MTKHLTLLFITLLQILFIANTNAQKTIYVPNGWDPSNSASEFTYERSRESENCIVFWQEGFGSDPVSAPDANLRVDVDLLLERAEKTFLKNRDDLKFVNPGNSYTDDYKLIIALYYTTEWMAYGSGYDNIIGGLQVNPAAAGHASTISHELGHCFQYQVDCDKALDSNITGGFRYATGPNGSVWWENCAQWQAYEVFPELKFEEGNYQTYLNLCYHDVLHEGTRYQQFFFQDYMVFKQDLDIIGRIWKYSNASIQEDPLSAYIRLAGLSTSEFNDEYYDYASRAVTWDIPQIKEIGENYMDLRGSNTMVKSGEYWAIDAAECIESYGYNVIRLNVTDAGTVNTVYFQGLAGVTGYRAVNVSDAGWRYGIVALLKDGTRVYSDMHSPKYDGGNPEDILTFTTPENCSKMWLVVSGAPQTFRAHQWDEDETNDEQWPYQVKFDNTNIYGEFDFSGSTPTDITVTYDVEQTPTDDYLAVSIPVDLLPICQAFCLSLSDFKAAFGSNVVYCAVNPDDTYNYNSTAIAPGHWFNKNGEVTNYANNSYVYSELKTGNYVFNIGQYPNLCQVGDTYTIRQAFVFTPEGGDPVTATIIFNYSIVNEITTSVSETEIQGSYVTIDAYPNPVETNLTIAVDGFDGEVSVAIYNMEGRIVKQAVEYVGMSGNIVIRSVGYKGLGLVKVTAGEEVKMIKMIF